MSLESRIRSIGDSIGGLAKCLAQRGYQFERPTDVFPGSAAGAATAMARIEREVGALPLALKLFWQCVGSVDLCGFHPEWEGCDYPDPLVVFPPSVALQELEEFLADKDERLRCNFPYLVPIAPDLYQKAGDSGGMWYNVSVPTVSDDPPLNDEWHRTTFVSYLELAIQWAGFPGLANCEGHSWPIREIVRETCKAS